MSAQSFPRKTMISLVMTLAGLIWFMLLGYRDLIDPDEGRYAEIARAMLDSGDWVTPRLNGYKYFEKPPLQYWGSAISMAVFGETNAAARVWCSGLGFIGVLWTAFVGNRLFGQPAGFYAFLMLVSSLLYVSLGHMNTLDMGVSVFLFIAVGSLVLAQTEREIPGHARNWMLLAWAGLAGATLSKGLIGLVLPGGAVVLYTIWQRDYGLWKNLHIGKGLILFLVLTAPWFILVSQSNPEFPEFFFIHEHFDRYTSGVHKRTKSWWFFFPVLIAGILPWAGSVISALVRPVFSWRAKTGIFEPRRFLWVYAIFVFFFFSISNSKLPPYILPMFFPIALLAADKAAKCNEFTMDAIAAILLAVALMIFGWNIVHFLAKPGGLPPEEILKLRPWVISAAVIMGVGGVSALIRSRNRIKMISVFALCSLLSVQIILLGIQGYSTKRSSRYLADAIRPYSEQGVGIYSVFLYDHSLSYYLGKQLNIVGFTGELQFGINQQPGSWVTAHEFMDLWPDYQQAVALLPKEIFHSWKEQNIPMRLIYQDSGHIAVARR